MEKELQQLKNNVESSPISNAPSDDEETDGPSQSTQNPQQVPCIPPVVPFTSVLQPPQGWSFQRQRLEGVELEADAIPELLER